MTEFDKPVCSTPLWNVQFALTIAENRDFEKVICAGAKFRCHGEERSAAALRLELLHHLPPDLRLQLPRQCEARRFLVSAAAEFSGHGGDVHIVTHGAQ